MGTNELKLNGEQPKELWQSADFKTNNFSLGDYIFEL
jgi:hypothetical protein